MVQDLSSQAMMAFQWERPVNRILDVCAAPGGKTTSLFLRWPQAEILSLEQHPRRARRLEENLKAREVPARIQVEEASAWLAKEGPDFDLILLDAPCSGSGTLRKHPELTWLGDGLDLERLINTQQSLLQAAATRLVPGGLLVFSVCSWLLPEGMHHRSKVMAAHPNLEPARVWPSSLGTTTDLVDIFQPDPLAWEGEGFQAFALRRH
jgi:16S rRNA (cytosine967-C5)-methyltransferase